MGKENKNGSIVFLEFARTVKGTVVKTHAPMVGELTYDVQIDYVFNPEAKKESFRIRDLPSRCLIWPDSPNEIWKDLQIPEYSVIERMEEMCKESLGPDLMESWEEITAVLLDMRPALKVNPPKID